MSLAARDEVLSRLLGQEWPHEPLLDALNMSPGLDVLEVGAGQGRLLHLLGKRGHTGRLTGLDPEPGAGVQAGTAEALPFPDQSFDVVFMIRMLSHCVSPLQALLEGRRVLRPGGRIVMAVQGKGHLGAMWKHAGRSAARGAEDDVQDTLMLAGLNFTRQEVVLPVQLTPPDALTLLHSYGLQTEIPAEPFPDALHLTLFQA